MDVEQPEAKVEETNTEEGTNAPQTLDYSKQLETNFAMVEQSVKILRAFWSDMPISCLPLFVCLVTCDC